MSFDNVGPVVLVGAGKMGLALAKGWLAAGLPPGSLVLVDPLASDATRSFAADRGVRLVDTPAGILVHVLVLAVKPQIMADLLEQIRPSVGAHTLVISIAAGISLKTLSASLATSRIIRTMPNTPAQIGKGVTGAVGLDVTPSDRGLADELLHAAGDVIWFEDEAMIDAVTAVSGSGPAYVFYMVEALAMAGMRLGLDAGQAMQLARKTIIGAAGLLESDSASAATLRENVTSPKGTTAAALDVLMAADGLEPLLERAVRAARRRSEELGRT